jgi:type IV secretion system protein VirB10
MNDPNTPPPASEEIVLQGEPDEAASTATPSEAAPEAMWRADRQMPSVNRSASVQGRITKVLGLVVFGGLTLGVLGWYYTQTATRASRESEAAVKAVRDRATGESTVPPLGKIDAPVFVPISDHQPTAEEEAYWHQEAVDGEDEEEQQEQQQDEEVPFVERVLPRPAQPSTAADSIPAVYPSPGTGVPPAYASFAAAGTGYGSADPELARRLGGEVLMTGSAGSMGAPAGASMSGATAPAAADSLESRLQPTVLDAAQARVLPTRRLLLPKGAMLDCTLETAIDSSLPGLVTCVTAQPAYSADGRVVLFERGTKLVGEVGGQVRRGQERLFVVWNEARTPTGVVVDLASPGTDALGRSGLTGEVDRHFGERFGAAILLSFIDGAIQAGVESQRQGDSSSIVVSPSGSRDIVGEVLEDSIGIAPTITVAPGTRVRVLVARDLDFRSVYALERVAR